MTDALPATYGGPTFAHRATAHHHEVANGRFWRTVGAADEYSQLHEVLLTVPPDTLGAVEDPDKALMLGIPDLDGMRRQMHNLATAYAALGITVHLHDERTAPPNVVFMRDLVFTTREGCAVGRPASPVRAAEAAVAQRALARAGVPLLGVPRNDALFEGADALWLDAKTLVVGLGTRTNRAALAWIRSLVGPSVQVIPVPLPRGTQHLLGVVVFLDENLAVVDQERLPFALRHVLEQRQIQLVALPPSDELRAGRGMNMVVTAPREVVMPAHCPAIRAALEAAHVGCRAVDVSAFLVAGGAMGCMTAILRRSIPDGAVANP